MVKLTGPGLATKATGGLADALIFSSSKGRAYLKTKRKPKQPRTGAQIGMRAMMKFLAPAWSLTPGRDPTTWSDLATEAAISPFNAYLGYNLERWRNADPPTINYPEVPTAPTRVWAPPGHQTIGRFVRINWVFVTLINGWGVTVYRVQDAIQHGTWNQLLGITYQPGAGTGYFDDLSPIVGLNRYTVSLISRDGYEVAAHWHVVHTFP